MKRRIKNEDGQALVEFALVAPLLFVLLFGIIQFGIAFKNSMTLADAVRVGARKAAVSRSLPDPPGAVKAAVIKAAADIELGPGDIDVDASASWQPGSDVTVSATYPYEINILGLVVASGDLHSETTERVEY
jgi:Flp pilus assembly protein TadG